MSKKTATHPERRASTSGMTRQTSGMGKRTGGMGKRSPGTPGRSLPVVAAAETQANKSARHERVTLATRATQVPGRRAVVERKTKETQITLSLDLDGTGRVSVDTGVGFFDHMLNHIGRHGLLDLNLKARGDLHVDDHHTVEDVGICLGEALAQAVGDKKGIRRYGFFITPMEESLAQVAIDLSGRAAVVYRAKYRGSKIGTFDVQLVEEFLRAVAQNARMNLHVSVPYGTNNHHIAEAIFKAFGKALRMACERDPREAAVPSTKGVL